MTISNCGMGVIPSQCQCYILLLCYLLRITMKMLNLSERKGKQNQISVFLARLVQACANLIILVLIRNDSSLSIIDQSIRVKNGRISSVNCTVKATRGVMSGMMPRNSTKKSITQMPCFIAKPTINNNKITGLLRNQG